MPGAIKINFEYRVKKKNKIHVIKSLEVLVPIYCFGIINWYQKELLKLVRKKRKLLIIHTQHHPNADRDGFYVYRKMEEVG